LFARRAHTNHVAPVGGKSVGGTPNIPESKKMANRELEHEIKEAWKGILIAVYLKCLCTTVGSRAWLTPPPLFSSFKILATALDKDKDGVISASDLRHVLTTVGVRLSQPFHTF
jgi:hypothetical protein